MNVLLNNTIVHGSQCLSKQTICKAAAASLHNDSSFICKLIDATWRPIRTIYAQTMKHM